MVRQMMIIEAAGDSSLMVITVMPSVLLEMMAFIRRK